MKKLIPIVATIAIIGIGVTYTKLSNKPVVEQSISVASVQKTEAKSPTVSELLAEVNKRRAEVGSPALALNSNLNKSAQTKCDEMHDQDYYDHVNPTTGKHGHTLGYELNSSLGQYGENLTKADQHLSAAKIFDNWFLSEKHKKAALDNRYTQTGFGYCKSDSQSADMYRTIVEHFYSPQTF